MDIHRTFFSDQPVQAAHSFEQMTDGEGGIEIIIHRLDEPLFEHFNPVVNFPLGISESRAGGLDRNRHLGQ